MQARRRARDEVGRFLRLYPLPGTDVGPGGIYSEVGLPRRARRDRPYVVANMVGSVDGVVAASGKASGIGSPEDRRIMRVLRSLVDAVMVGAGTLRAEKINLGLDEPGARQPLAVVVAGTGGVNLDNLADNGQEVLVATPARAAEDRPEDRHSRTLIVGASGDGRVDIGALLGTLRRDHGVERLLVEGGPSLNRALVEGDLLDELFLTVAPKLLPDAGPGILGHPKTPGAPARGLSLVSVHAAGDELFLRYRLPSTA